MEKGSKRMNTSTNITREGCISYKRAPIEIESPEEFGYERIKYNLTESSVPDMMYADLELNLEDLPLSYTHHMGDPDLRQFIAQESGITEDNVLITAGAAAALFIIATSLLKASDHVVVLYPNYTTNIETPKAIGCRVEYLTLLFEEEFKLDLEKLEEIITPDTRLISLTYPNNPTGAMITEKKLKKIIDLVEFYDCYLLLDETYREMVFDTPLPIAASLSPRVISVSSMSKSFGLPGIRIGWLITQNNDLIEKFLAAKEQIFICNSVLNEKIAHSFLKRKKHFFSQIKKHIDTNFRIMKSWITTNNEFEWIEPAGGCTCFPRICSGETVDIQQFYTILNQRYKTFVGPGHWFGTDDRYMRIGYAWPSVQELEGGLRSITRAMKEVQEEK